MYREKLSGVVEIPEDKEFEEPVYHNFMIQCDERDKLQKYLLEKGIETKIRYPIPIHLQEAASPFGYKKGDFPVAERQARRILSLPIYPELTDEKIKMVIDGIRAFYAD